MSRYKGFSFLVFVVLSIGLACSFPGLTMPDAGAVSTAAAQTVIAGLTQGASPETPSPVLELTSTLVSTFTPGPPTLTPTQTFTPTLPFTATPSIPLISVSVNTNCRTGPGKVYPLVGALLVGEVAEVYGRDPTGRYWYIRNPDRGDGFCWVWGEYATLAGPFLSLPVFTPPPTPTITFTPTPTITPTPSPNFTVKYEGKDSCSEWWLEVRVKNTGSTPLRSMRFRIKDTVTGTENVALSDGFTNLDGCSTTQTKDKLAPGDEFIISSPLFSYDPTGNKMRVTLTLCTQNSQKGRCVTQKISFKP
ncbi:SH3 domain-containing protein [Chloroflexi bacterium CFX2]|nr:SH3 domain-containing protein [Chloroflexi bacterium CFX2]